MEEKRIVQEETVEDIQNADILLEREEENPGIGYEIGFGSTNSWIGINKSKERRGKEKWRKKT